MTVILSSKTQTNVVRWFISSKIQTMVTRWYISKMIQNKRYLSLRFEKWIEERKSIQIITDHKLLTLRMEKKRARTCKDQ